MLACLNTDVPAVQCIELQYEYNTATLEAGLTQNQIRLAQKNSLTMAFLSEHEKRQLISVTEKKRHQQIVISFDNINADFI